MCPPFLQKLKLESKQPIRWKWVRIYKKNCTIFYFYPLDQIKSSDFGSEGKIRPGVKTLKRVKLDPRNKKFLADQLNWLALLFQCIFWPIEVPVRGQWVPSWPNRLWWPRQEKGHYSALLCFAIKVYFRLSSVRKYLLNIQYQYKRTGQIFEMFTNAGRDLGPSNLQSTTVTTRPPPLGRHSIAATYKF